MSERARCVRAKSARTAVALAGNTFTARLASADPYGQPHYMDSGRGFWERDVYRVLHGREMPETLDPAEQARRSKDMNATWALSRHRKIKTIVSERPTMRIDIVLGDQANVLPGEMRVVMRNDALDPVSTMTVAMGKDGLSEAVAFVHRVLERELFTVLEEPELPFDEDGAA